jgi:hypothetical protein
MKREIKRKQNILSQNKKIEICKYYCSALLHDKELQRGVLIFSKQAI